MVETSHGANAAGRLFSSTRWTVVAAAGESKAASSDRLSALTELCRIYWQPIFVFLRREGFSREDAQDLTQSFFAYLIESRCYERADKEKGRFRSFLLGVLKHFVADARDHEYAQKRGGGRVLAPLDEAAITMAEAQAARSKTWSTDCVYDREWAAALLRQALRRLAEECGLAGKAALFEGLKSHLATGSDGRVPYQELSRELRRPAATLRSDVARLRARYRAILREEVRGTVLEASEVDEELRHLSRALAA